MSSTAKRLSTKTKQTMAGVIVPLEKTRSLIKNVLKALFYGRVGISLVLLGWVLFISYRLTRTNTDDEKEHDRYFYLHRVWMGEESVIMVLFNMWYYSFILLMLSPILSWGADFLKIYLATGKLVS